MMLFNKLKMLTVAFLLVLLCSGQGFCADAQSVTNEMRAVYEHMKSFRASFTQELLHKESNSIQKRNGSLAFRKPLLVRWETFTPNAELLIINEKEIWDFIPDEEIAYRYSLDLVQDSRTLIKVITGQARLDQDFKVREDGVESNVMKLRCFPKEPAMQMVEAVIWVDLKTKLIRKASIIDFYGNTNTVRFNDFKPDADIKDRAFSFTPPKNVEVEDRVQKGVQERELFH